MERRWQSKDRRHFACGQVLFESEPEQESVGREQVIDGAAEPLSTIAIIDVIVQVCNLKVRQVGQVSCRNIEPGKLPAG
jgi:hypothetical protein